MSLTLTGARLMHRHPHSNTSESSRTKKPSWEGKHQRLRIPCLSVLSLAEARSIIYETVRMLPRPCYLFVTSQLNMKVARTILPCKCASLLRWTQVRNSHSIIPGRCFLDFKWLKQVNASVVLLSGRRSSRAVIVIFLKAFSLSTLDQKAAKQFLFRK